jgi:hypothetical protein
MLLLCGWLTLTAVVVVADEEPVRSPAPEEVLKGLRQFYARTARPDGSFAPGVDPDYRGMSDSAYSDLAPVTYAVTIHKTFGWKLPHEEKTLAFLLARQKADGSFVNVAGTVDPDSAEGKTYNTTQALVALRALGVKPRHDPLPVFEEILKQDYKSLPPYTTSFFPLAYLCYGRPIPEKADRGIRALMVQDETGYTNDHIAATFHASHYYRLVGETTPRSHEMVQRILRDQKADGSWMLNLPSRDRHATFDAVFTLRHEGVGREDCRRAIERAARWALSCRNPDGGFGHYPGSTSDADAIYFHVGTLVMAGFLRPADPLPPDPHLLSWGHLMPLPDRDTGREQWAARLDGWVAAVAFAPDGTRLASGGGKTVQLRDAASGRPLARLEGPADSITSVSFAPDGRTLAAGSYDHTARLWDLAGGDRSPRTLKGHRGAVMSVAFSPDGRTLATASIDGTIRLWDVATGTAQATLEGHRSWVNAVAFSPDGKQLTSASSDGTIRIWSASTRQPEKTLEVTKAEVRCLAWSPDGQRLAAGIRYGMIKVWDPRTWQERLSFQGHESDVWSVAFTPDATTLVSGNGDWNRAGHVKRWTVADGKHAGSFQHTGEVLGIAVSPDGRRLAAGGGDRMVRVWTLGNEPRPAPR